MRDISEVVCIIESLACELYGSVNKMLTENNINSSIVGNMKRKKPSIPNIIDFCKLAEALNVSLDYLLLENNRNYPSNTVSTNSSEFDNNFNNQITVDEHNLLQTYREVDNVGKNKIQDSIREIWIEHRNPKNKLSHSEENLNDTTA